MRFVSGLILIDAESSALNMFGTDETVADRNKMVVKKLKRGKNSYVYVSAQSWRYWWRQTLENQFKWNTSPLKKVESKNQVYTNANPLKYEDDDVFGYMRASEGLTVTRASPLKNTPLISVLPLKNSVTNDAASASRHEGNPVRYDSEFYSTVLKGAFSLDLNSVGKFLFKDKAGFKNLINIDKLAEEIEKSKIAKKKKEDKLKKLEKLKEDILWQEDYLDVAKEICVEPLENEWLIHNKIRSKRAKETIESLRYLSGGAKQTLFLTDVTPKFILLAMFKGGLNPFISDLIQEDKGDVKFNADVLINRITDFKEVINPKKIFIGKDKGFMEEIEPQIVEIKSRFKNDENNGDEKIEVVSGSVAEVIEEFLKDIDNYYDVKT